MKKILSILCAIVICISTIAVSTIAVSGISVNAATTYNVTLGEHGIGHRYDSFSLIFSTKNITSITYSDNLNLGQKTYSIGGGINATGYLGENNSVALARYEPQDHFVIFGYKVGKAKVQIFYNGSKTPRYIFNVTVKNAPSSISLSDSKVTLGKGENYCISEHTNSGSYARNFDWSYSSLIKEYNENSGNKFFFTAKNTGNTNIVVETYNKERAYCEVVIKPAPTSVKLNKTSLTLSKGSTYTLSESTSSGSWANPTNLNWSSSNTSVATVSKGSGNKGIVKAVKKGTSTITIKTYNGKTASCKVTVK